MNKKELRIGNVVNYSVGTSFNQGIISSLGNTKAIIHGTYQSFGGTNGVQSEIKYCNIDGVKLTEDLLIKIGSIKCDSPEEQGYFLGKYRVFANSLGQINFCFFDFGDWYQHLEYLHQLQNLYFALSNEEV